MSEGSGITKNTNTSSIVLALSGYIVLFAGKLITYFFTKITVLYAEALHSLADVIITIFLLIAKFIQNLKDLFQEDCLNPQKKISMLQLLSMKVKKLL